MMEEESQGRSSNERQKGRRTKELGEDNEQKGKIGNKKLELGKPLSHRVLSLPELKQTLEFS